MRHEEATARASVSLPNAWHLPAASEESDKVRVAAFICSVAYVMLCGPHRVEFCPLFPFVDHRHLLAVHLDAVAGEDVDYEELEVGLAFDLLQQSSPDFVDCEFAGVDQQSNVVHVVPTEGVFDYGYVFVDLG